jgi:carbonic anhydrase
VRPLEQIVTWNHRFIGGETTAQLPADAITEGLPLIALTCIDPRLNAHFPKALGLRPEQFIWLRNAANVITGSASSTMRSLALACAVKHGREIAIIGHTDCGVRKMTMAQLIEGFRELGISREALPDDLVSFFGIFASERQNVIRAVEFARHSPLIGPRIPVHGLLIDVESAKLEWIVNGYDTLSRTVTAGLPAAVAHAPVAPASSALPVPQNVQPIRAKPPVHLNRKR